MKAVRVMGVLSIVLVLAAAAWAAPAKVLKATGSIEAVTVYRGEALVTRVIPLDAPAGPVDLTVTGLPAQIRSNSLFASGDQNVQLRAVQFPPAAAAAEHNAARVRPCADGVGVRGSDGEADGAG